MTASGATSFAYDDADVLRESGPAGIQLLVHGEDTDEPLARELGGVPTYLHADGSNNVVASTSANGASVGSYTYGAYGEPGIGLPDGHAFTGREWGDAEGLYYYRERYYEPRAGRFLNEDPIRFAGGINFYEYALSNPVNLIDPTGLAVKTVNCGKSSNIVKAAAAKADGAAQTCLPPKHRPACKIIIPNLTVECVKWNVEPDFGREICARPHPSKLKTIQLTPRGLKDPDACGCLKATILHEALHLLKSPDYPDDHGGRKDGRFDQELKCFTCG